MSINKHVTVLLESEDVCTSGTIAAMLSGDVNDSCLHDFRFHDQNAPYICMGRDCKCDGFQWTSYLNDALQVNDA